MQSNIRSIRLYTLTLLLSVITSAAYVCYGQHIVNITTIPVFPKVSNHAENIYKVDGQVYSPFSGTTHKTFENLPEMEVDSFYTPLVEGTTTGSVWTGTMYAYYEPEIGFTEFDVVNVSGYKELSFDEEYIGLAHRNKYGGINDHLFFPFPENNGSRHAIVVYDKELDSIIYDFKIEGIESGGLNMKQTIEGDYIYVNLGIPFDGPDSLEFMGDTLVYWGVPGGPDDVNYLSKINFKTGEKGSEVTAVIEKTWYRLTKIFAQNTTIVSTDKHPFYCSNKDKYLQVDNLEEGFELLDFSGNKIIVDSI